MMTNSSCSVTVRTLSRGDATVLTADGVLDSSTYQGLRNSVIDAALADSGAVVVDVTGLEVPTASAWTAFSSARWHVSVWPDVPVALVCGHSHGREALARTGVPRHLGVYPTLGAAVTSVRPDDDAPLRRRVRTRLPALHSSLRRARAFTTEALLDWSHADIVSMSTLVVDVLVENVLEHTGSAPGLVVENCGDTVAIAVEDTSRAPAVRHEHPRLGGETASGLGVVAALARSWGSTPTSTGKTVWAVLGPQGAPEK